MKREINNKSKKDIIDDMYSISKIQVHCRFKSSSHSFLLKTLTYLENETISSSFGFYREATGCGL